MHLRKLQLAGTRKTLELKNGETQSLSVEDTNEGRTLTYIYVSFFHIYTDVEKQNIMKEMKQADTSINMHMPEDTLNTMQSYLCGCRTDPGDASFLTRRTRLIQLFKC